MSSTSPSCTHSRRRGCPPGSAPRRPCSRTGMRWPPPELARDAPVLDVFQPVVVDLFPRSGEETDELVAHGVARLHGHRVLQEPLLGEPRLDRHARAFAVAHVVLVRLLLHQQAELAELLHRGPRAPRSDPARRIPRQPGRSASRWGSKCRSPPPVAQADLVVHLVMGRGHLQHAPCRTRNPPPPRRPRWESPRGCPAAADAARACR